MTIDNGSETKLNMGDPVYLLSGPGVTYAVPDNDIM